MILEEIRLNDFRCFYGKTSISFSEDPKKNVTIIYAENGVGKTTLLNALLWCFYGETTARFEKRDEILNNDAKKAGRTVASVDVLFEHNDNHYIAKRFASIDNTSSREFIVARIESGSQINLDTPDTFINTVIPRDMASHFLFDGEQSEVLISEKNRKAIKSAVRDILGCSLVETAIEDLAAISTQFRRQIPTTATTKKIEDLNRQIDTLSSQIETAKDTINKLNNDREQTDQQVRDIDDKLRNTSAAKEIQSNRDRLAAQLVRTQRRQKDYSDEVYKWLGENGRFIVSKKITEETFTFLDEKEHRGHIPSPYNEEFVKDILEAEECICGAKLKPGSPQSNKVASLLAKAANQVMRDRISKIRARLTTLKIERAKAPSRLMKAKHQLTEANDEISSLEAQLAEISARLKDINFDDIAQREQRRSELKDKLREIDQKVGALKSNLTSTERDKLRIESDIIQLAKLDQQTAVHLRRLNLCESIKGKLETELATEENQARKLLRAGISRILKSTSRKILTLRMTDDYEVSLVNDEGMPVAKTTGENQLLGLAFTAALVEFAKIRKDAQDPYLLRGTIAPLVIDSPFGQLDNDYRLTTAEFIPKMARQVVLLVSSSQGTEPVLKCLRDHIGAEYLLVRHNKGIKGDRKTESRSLYGKVFQTAVFESEFDGTKILEIKGS